MNLCEIYFIYYLNANKRGGIDVETKVRKKIKKNRVFSVLVFYLIKICYNMYFKSSWSYPDLSFGIPKKGLALIIRELEASKVSCQ